MAERARQEPTVEEIVVALREATRDADRVHPLAVTRPSRDERNGGGINNETDVIALRDGEVARLLQENAWLNARVVSLLKIIEHEQAAHAESAAGQTAETTRIEADREANLREVKMAVEAELVPILLAVLRLLENRRANPEAGEAMRGAGVAPAAYEGPSGWIVDLMQRLEDKAPMPNETVTAADPMPRRPKLRELWARTLKRSRPEP